MKTLEWEYDKLKLIDQRKLPDELTYFFVKPIRMLLGLLKT